MVKNKITIGITGASGAIYGRLLLKRLYDIREQLDGCGIIFSENSRAVWKYELGEEPEASVDPDFMKIYRPGDFFAPMASGSAGYDAMIICPCTMGTLGRIAAGMSNDLMTRTADVMLKERRRLLLVPREAPFSLIHLNNMKLLTEAGAIICPASPSFYSRPESINDVVMTVVDRVISLAGFDVPGYHWGSDEPL